MDNLPSEVTEQAEPVEGEAVAAATMLPSGTTFFHHDGSLTTPPCPEGVSWQALTTKIELSAEQVAAFTDSDADDARPVRSVGDRELEVSGR